METEEEMKSDLGGTNANHWVNPWERDTTRGGYGELTPFPSMHSSEVEATVEIATCECCGVSFGYMIPDDPRPYCPSHSWLGTTKPLGRLFLSGIKYRDTWHPEHEIEGRNVRYSYFFPESDPAEAQKLWLALRVWLQAEYLEQVGLDRLPKVTLTKEGVLVSDLQHLQRRVEGNGTSASSIGSETLTRLMRKMDEVYVEAL